MLGYFRRNRHRMQHATMRKFRLPVGTGDVECTSKNMVTGRMKGCGMRWRQLVGQAVLSFAVREQSGRLDAAWKLLMVLRNGIWGNKNRPCEPVKVAA